MFCKSINCLCSTRFLLTVNRLCSSILEVIKIYIYIYIYLYVYSIAQVFHSLTPQGLRVLIPPEA